MFLQKKKKNSTLKFIKEKKKNSYNSTTKVSDNYSAKKIESKKNPKNLKYHVQSQNRFRFLEKKKSMLSLTRVSDNY